jgi:hypothetical protein
MTSLTASSPIFQHDDFRSIAQRYAMLTDNDAIIIPYGWEPTLDYYAPKLNVRARFIEIPLHSPADTIRQRLTTELVGVRRAEILTWFQLPADVRGAYSCILGALGEPDEHSLTTSGLKTDTYVNVGRYVPLRFANTPQQLLFEGIRLGPSPLIGYRGERGVCVISQWTLSSRTDRDWRLVMRLDNHMGWTLWQSDVLLLNDRQQPTPKWQPDQPQTAFSFFPLPAGAPDTDLTLTAGIYDLTSGQALVPDTEQTIKRPGNTVVLGTGSAPYRAQWDYPFVPGSTVMPAPPQELAPGFALATRDVPRTLVPGQTVRLTLDWRQTRPIDDAAAQPVVLMGDGFTVTSDPCIHAHQGAFEPDSRTYTIVSWCELRVPATASGTVRLLAQSWYEAQRLLLADYTVAAIPRLYELPAVPLNARPDSPALFGRVATLLGAQLPAVINAGQPLDITLVWRAETTADAVFKVFVHLTAPDGAIIAQSDAEPAGNTRPTTTWLTGEYLTDHHTLMFNQPGYRGAAKIVVGLYNPADGSRVLLSNNADHIVLPLSIRVE